MADSATGSDGHLETEEYEHSVSIPSAYEESSLESKLSLTIPGTNDNGWNSDGVPATFAFPDGVLVRYMEIELSDVDMFVELYDRQRGYRFYTTLSPEDLHAQAANDDCALLCQYVLDFSGHADYEGSEEELTVAVNELQAGSDGPIAGSIIFGDDIDSEWVERWIDTVIQEGWKVEPF